MHRSQSNGHCHDSALKLVKPIKSHDYCFCTWDLTVGISSLKRHFHLPKDWLVPTLMDICQVNEEGMVLCPRGGKMAVIRGGIKL